MPGIVPGIIHECLFDPQNQQEDAKILVSHYTESQQILTQIFYIDIQQEESKDLSQNYLELYKKLENQQIQEQSGSQQQENKNQRSQNQENHSFLEKIGKKLRKLSQASFSSTSTTNKNPKNEVALPNIIEISPQDSQEQAHDLVFNQDITNFNNIPNAFIYINESEYLIAFQDQIVLFNKNKQIRQQKSRKSSTNSNFSNKSNNSKNSTKRKQQKQTLSIQNFYEQEFIDGIVIDYKVYKSFLFLICENGNAYILDKSDPQNSIQDLSTFDFHDNNKCGCI
ncbi:hypothetical protein PPERSA_04214 [Pseudocohnilembus persalinus]|uniref:Uncharacterized protein n=1 Tax=Pseudocohnilembus persalinus TaxID=266149 RepID=A0A0V0QN17_PSEPJ|nr:hypothetical protein PPERSA_04214 [Pseudocohnilembus persalinus]|eukprot:KRX03662.1 hypothetical protein PPERSA_04214 [Pseudocohnilembus persalinus]